MNRARDFQGWLSRLAKDARGLQTLEWVALAIVILAFLGAIAAFLGNQGENTVGRAVAGAIQRFFEGLGNTLQPLLGPFSPFPIERTG
ncbi:MAG: hypothetical protein RMM10_05715 [Anaerolineae bacterium]|nr:hypothetical protein [Thermoflexus sp.]MCS7351008.1 hypothetical protein [Thermoflexus sp.]MDW8180460.1 hypothetical protein [Anaerolineae bacterium]